MVHCAVHIDYCLYTLCERPRSGLERLVLAGNRGRQTDANIQDVCTHTYILVKAVLFHSQLSRGSDDLYAVAVPTGGETWTVVGTIYRSEAYFSNGCKLREIVQPYLPPTLSYHMVRWALTDVLPYKGTPRRRHPGMSTRHAPCVFRFRCLPPTPAWMRACSSVTTRQNGLSTFGSGLQPPATGSRLCLMWFALPWHWRVNCHPSRFLCGHTTSF